MKLILILALTLVAATALADGTGRIVSKYARKDAKLTADPNSAFWKGIEGVFAENGPTGATAINHRTEIRSRWTTKNLYFLFICPYDQLHLKPNPSTTTETNKLWEWDVAEVFVGADFKNPRHYREYQVSPQEEWVDLDIDRDHPLPEGGWKWNSGFKVKARIDEKAKIWYGEMQIPIASINAENGPAQAKPGAEMRINFYRLQGPRREISIGGGPPRVMVAWQPTNQLNYHVPEAFGRLVLEK